jgi:acetyl esterase
MNSLRTLCLGLITALLGTAFVALQDEIAAQEQNPAAKKAPAKGPPQKPASTTPADMTNVVYGSDPKFNVIDLWQAKSDKPTPLVVFIHGGGFGGGDKDQILTQLPLDEFLKAGVSCASIDYRRLQSHPGPRQIIYPTLFLDCARAVQFLRHHAKEWNLDPMRFACSGGSAGAGMSLWIGFHKDLADPKSDDPVARESTRLTCVAVFNAQTAYDPRWIKEHLPGKAYMVPNIWQLVGLDCPPRGSPVEQFDEMFKALTPEKARLMEDCSPINHLTAEAPPVFLHYRGKPLKPRRNENDDIHQIGFALKLKEKMDALNVECEIVGGWPANPETTGPDKTDLEFVLRHFGMKP